MTTKQIKYKLDEELSFNLEVMHEKTEESKILIVGLKVDSFKTMQMYPIIDLMVQALMQAIMICPTLDMLLRNCNLLEGIEKEDLIFLFNITHDIEEVNKQTIINNINKAIEEERYEEIEGLKAQLHALK